MSLVSRGCEIIHVSRKRILDVADETTLEYLRKEIKIYPEDDVLYKRFLDTDIWEKYKHKVYTKSLPQLVKRPSREMIMKETTGIPHFRVPFP